MLNMTKLCQWAKTNVQGTTIRIGKRNGSVFLDIEIVRDDTAAYVSFDLHDQALPTDAEIRQHILATASEVE